MDNVVDCETSTKKTKPKVIWDNATVMEFLDVCLNEVKNGNKPGMSFNKIGWLNIEKHMNKNTAKLFEQKQIKNKWENLKRDWKLYIQLIRHETGIGGTRSLLDASSEWWEEKIKVDKDFAKFRGANLEIYESHYAPLFRDCVAVGDHAMTPLQFGANNRFTVQSEENKEGSGDSDEINTLEDEPLFPSNVSNSSNKRKKSKNVDNARSTKSKTLSFENKLDVVLEALSTKSTQSFPPNNLSPTISDCMNIVMAFPGFEEGSRKYTQALSLFIKKQNREAFMFPTSNEAKMELLKLLMEE